MALIQDRPGRRNGGYERLFGHAELGLLVSKVQGAVISAGTELERLLRRQAACLDNLDAFLAQDQMPEGVFLADKKQLKKSQILSASAAEPDFLVFRRRSHSSRCHVVELKDGDTFDTKKASGERNALETFVGENARHIPFQVRFHICCFNQGSRQAIVQGFKNKISSDEALTGREFCELLEIDYDRIVEARKKDQESNLAFFVDELLKIQPVQDRIKQRIMEPSRDGLS